MWNRILDGRAREEYKQATDELFALAPEVSARKPIGSIVQHSFILDSVKKLHSEGPILVVGAFEDAPYEVLVRLGYGCVPIDPCINFTVEEYYNENPDIRYQLIYANSVLEHVADDEGFIRTLCHLCKSGGYILLTFDFNPLWVYGEVGQPTTCLRQYSLEGIARIQQVFREEGFEIGEEDYEGEIDFEWEGYHYSFASLVAQKI